MKSKPFDPGQCSLHGGTVELQPFGQFREARLGNVAAALCNDSDQVGLGSETTVCLERFDRLELAGRGRDRSLEVGRFRVDDPIEVSADRPRDLPRFEFEQCRSAADEPEKRAHGLGALPGDHSPTAAQPPRSVQSKLPEVLAKSRLVIGADHELQVRAAGGKDNVGGIGICAPGPLNPKTGVVLNPPNLPGWRNIELAKQVEAEFGLPAKLENDANAAGLAEVLFGAAVGYRDIFYVTVSTGVGTGIIINKKIYHGKNGIAGEGGHVSVDYRSPYRCGCGTYGCIEALAAGPGMARRARVMLEQEHDVPSVLRDLAHGHATGRKQGRPCGQSHTR